MLFPWETRLGDLITSKKFYGAKTKFDLGG